ncbi:MAG: serine--tRNA ligase [Candidatus Marinimicrobia bacterium]|nr:serine--tRNA ligase [Candidatus Neomarinimicrobiota bacterium]
MITLKNIRENQDLISKKLKTKNFEVNKIEKLLNKDSDWREGLVLVEKLKEKRNSASKQISILKKENKPADDLISEMKNVSSKIKEIDSKNVELKIEIDNLLLDFPNIPHDSVPLGSDESSNKIIRTWGEKPKFEYEIKSHIEISEKLNLLDFKAGSKISGSGFPVYIKNGAKLERSLINFMLDMHVENGYDEMFPPFLVNSDSMQTTGQMPKFIDDMYQIPKDQLFCIPTAEVPVTNYYRSEQLDESELPVKFAAYSACFRREAGSYGKDTRGLLRLHQFNKVELVKFVHPDNSYNELESLLEDAEKVLQSLGLHYRVIELCTGDLSFSAAKCYDVEVWSPYENKYLEVSSCSNFESFQANRGSIRFRSSKTGKMEFVHTLNGSGVATPRLLIALIENYQQKDGTIKIPKALQRYMNISAIED